MRDNVPPVDVERKVEQKREKTQTTGIQRDVQPRPSAGKVGGSVPQRAGSAGDQEDRQDRRSEQQADNCRRASFVDVRLSLGDFIGREMVRRDRRRPRAEEPDLASASGHDPEHGAEHQDRQKKRQQDRGLTAHSLPGPPEQVGRSISTSLEEMQRFFSGFASRRMRVTSTRCRLFTPPVSPPP